MDFYVVFSASMSNCDVTAFQALSRFETSALVSDGSVASNLPSVVFGTVFDRRQLSWKGARTGFISGSWDLHIQSFVRPVEVVDGSPAVELLLTVYKSCQAPMSQNFCFE